MASSPPPRRASIRAKSPCTVSGVLSRQWKMLGLIPRQPQRIRVDSLRGLLLEDGMSISSRTVQRDLKKLALRFPIVCDERSRPFEWAWAEDADRSVLEVPSGHAAFAQRVAELHVRATQQRFDLPDRGTSRLSIFARVEGHVAMALLETPLCIDQHLTRGADGWWNLRVSVVDGPAFRAWVLVQGRGIVIDQPLSLRDALIATLDAGLAAYNEPTQSPSLSWIPAAMEDE